MDLDQLKVMLEKVEHERESLRQQLERHLKQYGDKAQVSRFVIKEIDHLNRRREELLTQIAQEEFNRKGEGHA